MDFQLNEEQKLLKNSAREFMEKEIVPIADEYDRKYRPVSREQELELFKKLVPLGYVGGLVPEEYGGGGIDYFSYGILLEELARAYGSLAIMEMDHHISHLCIYLEGTEEAKAKYLPATASGNKICCYCLTEPDVGSGARDISTTAIPEGNEYIINGTKTWITNGNWADLAMVVAVTEKGKGAREFSRFLVDRSYSDFTARDLPKLGICSCPTAELSFEDCRVSEDNLIGKLGGGYEGTMETFQAFRSGLGVIAAGLAQAAIDASVRYALDRKQFGRPIGSFQLVQEMIVDMVIETEAARLISYQAFDLLKRGISCFKESSMAKAFGPEVALRVTSKGIQVHGSYGLSEEYPLERYFRDARSLSIPDGTTEIQKLIMGREILGIKAFV